MRIFFDENEVIEINGNESCYDLLKMRFPQDYNKYLSVKVNNQLKELNFSDLKDGDKLKFIDLKDRDGKRVYIRTLKLIFLKVTKEIFDDVYINIQHSLNKGLYVEMKLFRPLTENDLNTIRSKMQEVIDRGISIHREMLSIDHAIEIFAKENLSDKILLLRNWHSDEIRTYELDGYYDMFYGYVAPCTDVISKFDLKLFGNGLILRFPDSSGELPEYTEDYKLAKVFDESEKWNKIMEVSNVSNLNDRIKDSSINDLILVNEALHEKRIAYIADQVCESEDIKLILIAGPSSSGKTTFAQRLSIQLRVNGKKTFAIGLDDYFVNREDTPLDENGEYDFETIEALDVDSFNKDLVSLIRGEEVKLPTFDFKLGKRKYVKPAVKLTKDHIIVVEGIHGLNERLTQSIPADKKFKIYISALTALNIDNHNRIPTTDTRLIRRIVRDNQFRGHDALRTMELWENVGKGERKFIFPYQENADAIFNSSTTYELSILKKYALPLIEKVSIDSEFYSERQRVLKFLSYFDVPEDDVETNIPQTSIIKEFLGGGLIE